jgi:hypothetical protein
MNETIAEAAAGYFEFLAGRFPVLCASDEFSFMPRAAAAARYYDRLDDFGKEAIEDFLSALCAFAERFDSLRSPRLDSESAADLAFLKSGLSGVLIEFGENRSWEHNPLLYLKIAFIGIDHALSKPAASRAETLERARSRLDAVPRLFLQAAQNLASVPESLHGASLAMAADCRTFLNELRRSLAPEEANRLLSRIEKAEAALAGFTSFLETLKPVPDSRFPAPDVEAVLNRVFLCGRTLEEIARIGLEEWETALHELETLAGKIAAGRDWREIYREYPPEQSHDIETIPLYAREVERLRSFFFERGLGDASRPAPEVVHTPTYLRSVRGTASFGAAFTKDPAEKDFFFITARLPEVLSPEAARLMRRRLHREYRFLAAHETFPGHGLLDATRRNLANPVRSQVESPLFYEGWATYAETLLVDEGYVEDPRELLVNWRRRLWRAARCRIDAGLATGAMSRADAVALLVCAGFGREESARQVDRFRLNPGYQLCYTLGLHEILSLRAEFAPIFGIDRFHRFLLDRGELPFPLIEKRLKALASTKGDLH